MTTGSRCRRLPVMPARSASAKALPNLALVSVFEAAERYGVHPRRFAVECPTELSRAIKSPAELFASTCTTVMRSCSSESAATATKSSSSNARVLDASL